MVETKRRKQLLPQHRMRPQGVFAPLPAMAEEHGLHAVQTGFRSAVKPQFCEPLEKLFRDLSRQATVSRTRASNQVALLAELLYELYENRLARQRNPCSEPLKQWPAIPDGFPPELTTRALSWQALWEAAWQRGEPMPDVSQHGVEGEANELPMDIDPPPAPPSAGP